MCAWVDGRVKGIFFQILRREIAFSWVPTSSINSSHPQSIGFFFSALKQNWVVASGLRAWEQKLQKVLELADCGIASLGSCNHRLGGHSVAISTFGSRGQTSPLLSTQDYPGNDMFMQTAFVIIALKQLKIELCLEAKHRDHHLCYIHLPQ